MTDEPATTPAADREKDRCAICGALSHRYLGCPCPDGPSKPAADRCGKCGSDLPERGCCPCIGATPAADRVTALTLRCGQLREQRDEARRACVRYRQAVAKVEAELDETRRERNYASEEYARTKRERDEARRERDRILAEWTIARERMITAERERDAARAQADRLMAATTDADDLRAVAREVITDCAARFCHKPATCACSMARMIRLMAPDGAGSVHRAETDASVAPSATPDLLGPQIGAES